MSCFSKGSHELDSRLHEIPSLDWVALYGIVHPSFVFPPGEPTQELDSHDQHPDSLKKPQLKIGSLCAGAGPRQGYDVGRPIAALQEPGTRRRGDVS